MIFEGLASTVLEDSEGSVLIPEGMSFVKELPVRFRHAERIGHVAEVRISHGGLWVRGVLDLSIPLAMQVWQGIRDGRFRALSVGFDPVGGSYAEAQALASATRKRYTQTLIREVSICDWGKNPGATILKWYSR